MAFTDEEGLLKQIKQKSFDNLYLIYGSEDFLKKHYVSQLSQKLVSAELAAFNSHSLDGRTATLDEIADCVLSLPFMSDYTCTVVHDMTLTDFAPHGRAKKTAGESEAAVDANDEEQSSARFEKLSELVSDIPPTSVLVFWMDTVTVDEKSGAWKKISTLIGKHGTVVNLGRRSRSALIKLLCDSASKKGCILERDVAAYIIERAGDDMGNLKNELDKLCSLMQGKKISKKAVDVCVIASLEANIFSLSKSICAGRGDEAFSTLESLLRMREEPVKILAILSGAYIDMYRVKAAVCSGKKPADVAELFKGYKGKEFVLTNAASSCAKYSLEQLRASLELLGSADTRMKSTGADNSVILQQLVLELMRI